jgi:hypothetical protein
VEAEDRRRKAGVGIGIGVDWVEGLVGKEWVDLVVYNIEKGSWEHGPFSLTYFYCSFLQ